MLPAAPMPSGAAISARSRRPRSFMAEQYSCPRAMIAADGGPMRFGCYVAAAILGTTSLVAQTSTLKYPQPRKDATTDDYFGTRVADPYRWMENLNSPELKTWIEQENALTFSYLQGLPARAALSAR